MYLLFYVGAKLLGIVYLSGFVSSLIAFVNIIQYDKGTLLGSLQYTVLAGYVFTVIINFIFSYFLLFKTNTIARVLRLESNDIKLENLSVRLIIHGGVVLIGIYIFSSVIKDFLNSLIFYVLMITSDKDINLLGMHRKIYSKETTILEVVINAIPVFLSLIFIFKSEKVLKIIRKFDKGRIAQC